jgi:hypothetical protein
MLPVTVQKNIGSPICRSARGPHPLHVLGVILGVILKRQIDPFAVIFRLGITRHSISHTRKWFKPMRNQNGIDSYRGSLFRHNLSDRQ